jgi:hypothetical protein
MAVGSAPIRFHSCQFWHNKQKVITFHILKGLLGVPPCLGTYTTTWRDAWTFLIQSPIQAGWIRQSGPSKFSSSLGELRTHLTSYLVIFDGTLADCCIGTICLGKPVGGRGDESSRPQKGSNKEESGRRDIIIALSSSLWLPADTSLKSSSCWSSCRTSVGSWWQTGCERYWVRPQWKS